MPLIKPRTRGKHFVRQRIRLEQENYETLHAYAAFLGEPVDYLLNQLFENVLSKDKDFAQWRTQHPQSYVPRVVRGVSPMRGRRVEPVDASQDDTTNPAPAARTRAS